MTDNPTKSPTNPTAEAALRDRVRLLEGAAKADKERLVKAAEQAGITYFGCDTPEHLADTVIELRSRCERLEGALNPRRWTFEMNAAWNRAIPDTQKAFKDLRDAALKDTANE